MRGAHPLLGRQSQPKEEPSSHTCQFSARLHWGLEPGSGCCGRHTPCPLGTEGWRQWSVGLGCEEKGAQNEAGQRRELTPLGYVESPPGCHSTFGRARAAQDRRQHPGALPLRLWGNGVPGRLGEQGRQGRGAMAAHPCISFSVPKLSFLTHHERSEAENQSSPCPLHL